MKVSNLFLLATLSVGLDSISATPATAQTLTTLYNFSMYTNTSGFNTDGADPANLILAGDKLYGTAWFGGASGNGDLFSINTNGAGFTNLHSFGVSHLDTNDNTTNVDGLDPQALVLSGDTLYGVAVNGGVNGNGTIFKINTNGAGFTNLHTFAAFTLDGSGHSTGMNADGAAPNSLMLLGNTLYGTAGAGGNSAGGTLFALSIDGSGFTDLLDFAGSASGPDIQILSGNTFYGTASGAASGLIFQVNTNGTGLSIVYTFSALSSNTNSDGAQPNSLILIGNTLYGTTSGGGIGGSGVIFSVNTNGMFFTNIHSFGPRFSNGTTATNSDGALPGAMVSSGSNLFGPALGGGTNGVGTLFQFNTNGSAFTLRYTFAAGVEIFTNGFLVATNTDGIGPQALIQSGNTIYGVTEQGGPLSNGTIFAFTLPPITQIPIPLYIQASGHSVILNWSNAAFSLQSAPALLGTFTNVPGATSPYTNPLTPAPAFFRLIH